MRDLHTGHEAARLMSLIMLVFSVSPMLAPITGSFIVQFGTWREIFWLTAVLGLAALAVAWFWLQETRPPAERIAFDAAAITRNYLALFRDRHYIGVVLIGAFGISSFFAYLAGSSFIFIDHFGLTPTQFSLAFSVNAIAFIGMAQFVSLFGKRFGLARVIKTALAFYLAMTTILLVITLAGVDNPFVLIGFLFVSFGAMGLVIPSTAPLAMQNYGATAGTASALMGTLQLVGRCSRHRHRRHLLRRRSAADDRRHGDLRAGRLRARPRHAFQRRDGARAAAGAGGIVRSPARGSPRSRAGAARPSRG